MGGKAWIRSWTRAVLLSVAAVLLFNYAVDPYGVHRGNALMKYDFGKDRLINSVQLVQRQFKTLIVGTSRAQAGLSPKNPLLEAPAYNISMPATNVHEIGKVVDYALDHQTGLRTLLYGVDFLTFSDRRLPGRQFAESLFGGEVSYLGLMGSLSFSLSATKDAATTLVRNLLGEPASYVDGYHEKGTPHAHDYEAAFREVLAYNFLINPETYGCYRYSPERLARFEETLRAVSARGVALRLFVPPMHFRQYVALQELGLLDLYFQWMKDLHRAVRAVAAEGGGGAIALYDFGGINAVTTEPVPTQGVMDYYWESSHYTSRTGDRMIGQILGGADGFGVRLDGLEDLDAYLDRSRRAMRAYFADHPEAVSGIRALVAETRDTRARNCAPYDRR